jgi:hypothetical protein
MLLTLDDTFHESTGQQPHMRTAPDLNVITAVIYVHSDAMTTMPRFAPLHTHTGPTAPHKTVAAEQRRMERMKTTRIKVLVAHKSMNGNKNLFDGLPAELRNEMYSYLPTTTILQENDPAHLIKHVYMSKSALQNSCL